jgi:hypothetical protein
MITTTPHIESLYLDIVSMTKDLIVKRDDLAAKYENINTIRESDYYIMAYKKEDTFMSYMYYDVEVLKAAGLTDTELYQASIDKMNIDIYKRDEILLHQRQYILDNYEEQNNYYRTLMGYPNVGELPLTLAALQDIQDVLNTTAISPLTPVHLLLPEEVLLLNRYGIIDKLISAFPKKEYLKYLGDRSIPPFKSRTAKNFAILQIGPSNNKSHLDLFKMNYYLSRDYILNTIYQHNMFARQQYGLGYIGMLMLFDAVNRTITSNIDVIINKDFYDADTLSVYFKSNGLDYFSSLPLQYQRLIAKNLNYLIKFKETDKVLLEITKLFGYKDVKIFKYNLVKEHKRDLSDNPIMQYLPDGSPDYDNMYDVYFSKVDIESKNPMDIRDSANKLNYESVVDRDPYWGVYESNASIKSKLLHADFNYMDSKYLAIHTSYNLNELNFEINYVFSTILAFKDNIHSLSVPNIISSKGISLFDTLISIFYLISRKNGSNGTIITDPASIATIYKFNYDANEAYLKSIYLKYNKTAPNDLSKYIPLEPFGEIIDKKEVLNFYFRNKNIYDILTQELISAKTIDDYSIIKDILDYISKSKQTADIYKKSDGIVATSYLEYLQDSDTLFSAYLSNLTDVELDGALNTILSALDIYIESDDIQFLFSHIPGTSDNLIREYISHVINVFKSYTVDLHSINILYYFDDITLNNFKIYDTISMQGDIKLGDRYMIQDTLKCEANMAHNEYINIHDSFECIEYKVAVDEHLLFWTKLDRDTKNLISKYGPTYEYCVTEKTNYTEYPSAIGSQYNLSRNGYLGGGYLKTNFPYGLPTTYGKNSIITFSFSATPIDDTNPINILFSYGTNIALYKQGSNIMLHYYDGTVNSETVMASDVNNNRSYRFALIIITTDTNNATIKFYLNDILKSTITKQRYLTTTDGPLLIGKLADGTTDIAGNYSSMNIDDFRVYNRELTKSELELIYFKSKDTYISENLYVIQSNLDCWYPMEFDMNDWSGNNNHLTGNHKGNGIEPYRYNRSILFDNPTSITSDTGWLESLYMPTKNNVCTITTRFVMKRMVTGSRLLSFGGYNLGFCWNPTTQLYLYNVIDTSPINVLIPTTVLSPNVEYSLALTYENLQLENKILFTLYLDGIKIGSNKLPKSTFATDLPLKLGTSLNTSDSMDGYQYDTRVYSSLLTLPEILSISNARNK